MDKLNDLLNLCLEYSDPDNPVVEPLHPENEEFLSEIIRTCRTTPSVEKTIEIYINNLKNSAIDRSSDDNLGEYIDILRELQDITSNIDFATNFVYYGGLDLISRILDDNNIEFRCEACELLAIVNQNHQFSQSKSIEIKLIEKLLNHIRLIDFDVEDNLNLLKKFIYALSCIVRGHKKAFVQFKSNNGFETMLSIICSIQSTVIRCKIAFFIDTVIYEFHDIIDPEMVEFCLTKLIDCLNNLPSFYLNETEYLLKCICFIFHEYPGFIIYFKNTTDVDSQFIDALEQKEIIRRQEYAEWIEIGEYIDSLSRILR